MRSPQPRERRDGRPRGTGSGHGTCAGAVGGGRSAGAAGDLLRPFTLSDYLADPDAGLAPLVDEAGQLADLGVDWLALMVPGSTRNEVIDRAGELAAGLGLG